MASIVDRAAAYAMKAIRSDGDGPRRHVRGGHGGGRPTPARRRARCCSSASRSGRSVTCSATRTSTWTRTSCRRARERPGAAASGRGSSSRARPTRAPGRHRRPGRGGGGRRLEQAYADPPADPALVTEDVYAAPPVRPDAEPGEDATPCEKITFRAGDQPGPRPGDGPTTRRVFLMGEDVADSAGGGVFQLTDGPVDEARRRPGAQHPDRRGGDRRRGDRLGDRRHAAGAGDHVLRLHRRLLGPAGEPRRQAALHVRRPDAGADDDARRHGRRHARSARSTASRSRRG